MEKKQIKTIEIDPQWMSKRNWSAIFAVVAIVAQIFGYEFDAELQAQASTMVVDIISLISVTISGVLAGWSKVVETKK